MEASFAFRDYRAYKLGLLVERLMADPQNIGFYISLRQLRAFLQGEIKLAEAASREDHEEAARRDGSSKQNKQWFQEAMELYGLVARKLYFENSNGFSEQLMRFLSPGHAINHDAGKRGKL